MRVVLYANDFEPITIFDLPHWAVTHLRRHHTVNIAVEPAIRAPTGPFAKHMTIGPEFYIVRIHAHPLRLHGQPSEHLMLFTYDEQSALLLKAAFLPGQQAALNEVKRDAFAAGFIDAMSQLGRGG